MQPSKALQLSTLYQRCLQETIACFALITCCSPTLRSKTAPGHSILQSEPVLQYSCLPTPIRLLSVVKPLGPVSAGVAYQKDVCIVNMLVQPAAVAAWEFEAACSYSIRHRSQVSASVPPTLVVTRCRTSILMSSHINYIYCKAVGQLYLHSQ